MSFTKSLLFIALVVPTLSQASLLYRYSAEDAEIINYVDYRQMIITPSVSSQGLEVNLESFINDNPVTPPEIIDDPAVGKAIKFNGYTEAYIRPHLKGNIDLSSAIRNESWMTSVVFRIDGPNTGVYSNNKQQLIIDYGAIDGVGGMGFLYTANSFGEIVPKGRFFANLVNADCDTTVADYSACQKKQFIIQTNEELLTQRWHKAIFGQNGNKLFFYLNGQLQNELDITGWKLITPHPDKFTVGADQANPRYFPFNGRIASIEIWNDVANQISKEQVKSGAELIFDFNTEPMANVIGDIYYDQAYENNSQLLVQRGTWRNNGFQSGFVEFSGQSGQSAIANVALQASPLGRSISLWYKPAVTSLPYTLYDDGGIKISLGDSMDSLCAIAVSEYVCGNGVASDLWNHVVVTYSGTEVSLIINGQVVNRVAVTSEIYTQGHTIHLGIDQNGGPPFIGKIDELMVFPRSLSVQEARRLFKVKANSTHAHEFLFDSLGFLEKDSGLRQNILSLVGGYSMDEDGVFGNALKLTGGHAVFTSEHTDLMNSGFTIGAWIKPSQITDRQIIISNDRNCCSLSGGVSLTVYPIISRGTYLRSAIQATVDTQLDPSMTPIKKSIYSSSSLQDNQWMHVALKYDGTIIKLFINGVMEAEKNVGPIRVESPFDWHVGTLAYQAPTYFGYKGLIDELFIDSNPIPDHALLQKSRPYKISLVEAIRNTWVLPNDLPWDAWPLYTDWKTGQANPIVIEKAANEYEAASFVITAANVGVQDSIVLNDILPSLSTDVEGSIRMVKAWYQGKGDSGSYQYDGIEAQRELKPELLVNSDNIFSVNTESRENIFVSDEVKGKPQDAQILQPVNIATGKNQQFWVTINPSESNYNRWINISEAGVALDSVPLEVVVTDDLPKSMMKYGIYYHGKIEDLARNHPAPDKVDHYYRTAANYQKEMENIHAHGVDNVTMYTRYQSFKHGNYNPDPVLDLELIDAEMSARIAAGMEADFIPYTGLAIPFRCASITQSEFDNQYGGCNALGFDFSLDGFRYIHLERYMGQLIDLHEHFKSEGYPELYPYGADEAVAEKLRAQVIAYKAIRDAGFTSTVALHDPQLNDADNKNYFTVLGEEYCRRYDPDCSEEERDIYGVQMIGMPIVLECDPYYHTCSEEFLNTIYAQDQDALVYQTPIAGIERPQTYRYKYGLWLWAKGLKGAMPYAYQKRYGEYMWDDFDNSLGKNPGSYEREQSFTYPTADGVVDTIQWEGFREGIDDTRYLTRLIELINLVNQSGNAENPTVIRANAYISALKLRFLEHEARPVDLENEMGQIRRTIRQYSTQIMGLMPDNRN